MSPMDNLKSEYIFKKETEQSDLSKIDALHIAQSSVRLPVDALKPI